MAETEYEVDRQEKLEKSKLQTGIDKTKTNSHRRNETISKVQEGTDSPNYETRGFTYT